MGSLTTRYTFTAESDGKRILKIGQHMAKLWTRVECPVFLTHGVYVFGLVYCFIVCMSPALHNIFRTLMA